ncbi:HNH endonuclease [Natrialbaceae archaeon GCM10025810]
MESEYDVPLYRGHDWTKRRNEILERDGEKCQRCGDWNNGEGNYVDLQAHHIVPGKKLPKDDARIDLNLITVCSSCHGWLEKQGVHTPTQFEEVGREDVSAILEELTENSATASDLCEVSGLSGSDLDDLLNDLRRLNLVEDAEDGQIGIGELAYPEWYKEFRWTKPSL